MKNPAEVKAPQALPDKPQGKWSQNFPVYLKENLVVPSESSSKWAVVKPQESFDYSVPIKNTCANTICTINTNNWGKFIENHTQYSLFLQLHHLSKKKKKKNSKKFEINLKSITKIQPVCLDIGKTIFLLQGSFWTLWAWYPRKTALLLRTGT